MPGQQPQSAAADQCGTTDNTSNANDTGNVNDAGNVSDAGNVNSASHAGDAGPGERAIDLTRRRWSRADLVAVLSVMLAALLVRGIYIYQQRSSPDFDTPVVDARFFDAWARAFAEGQRFTEDPYYRGPLYSWVLGVTYKVFGTGPVPWRIVQALFGALTCGLVFLIGRLLFSRLVGLIAGLAAATYWTLVYFTGEMLIPTLITLLDVLLVLALLAAYRRKRLVLWGLGGAALGLSAIARPNILLLAPAVVIWIAVIRWPSWRTLLGTTAVFTIGCLLPVLPVTVRNYVVGHDRVLISSQGGVNLYIGNNPQADGYNVLLPETRFHWRETVLDQIAIAEKAEGRKLRPSEVSSYYLKRTWEFLTTQPGTALALLYKKFMLFWNTREFANNKDLYDYTARYTPIVKCLPLTFGVIAPLGVLGIAVSWRRRAELFPLWGFALVYMVSVVLFFVSARFRVPVLPVLLLYAAVGGDWMVRTMARRRWRPAIEGVLLLGLLAIVSNTGRRWESMPGSWEMVTAGVLTRDGKLDQAVAQYKEALAQNPGNFEAYGALAAVHLTTGDLGAAESCARRAVALNPNYARGHDSLGAALARQGRLDEALVHLRRSVELIPHDVTAQQHLGSALVLGGHLAEAAQHLRKALELEPQRADTLASLGFVAAQQGDPTTALERFAESVSIDPTAPDVYAHWARVLQSEGRPAEAVAVLRRGLQHNPDHLPSTIRLARLLLTTPDPTIRDPAQALRLAETVCDRDGRTNPRTLHLLVSAYAVAGRCDDAVREARRAIPLAEQAGLTSTARQLQVLIERCASGQPFQIREAPTQPRATSSRPSKN